MKEEFVTIAVLLIFGLCNLQAQEAIPATGGEASGNGGSASYTVGQVVYTTITGTNGSSVAQGVQQPYEIYVVTAIPEAKDISLKVSAYPNPATTFLTIKVENYETADLQYLLYDIGGKLLKIVKATGRETKIVTGDLLPAIYFIKVIDKQKEIKVFKIIKK
jgi:hypothetical protein